MISLSVDVRKESQRTSQKNQPFEVLSKNDADFNHHQHVAINLNPLFFALISSMMYNVNVTPLLSLIVIFYSYI